MTDPTRPASRETRQVAPGTRRAAVEGESTAPPACLEVKPGDTILDDYEVLEVMRRRDGRPCRHESDHAGVYLCRKRDGSEVVIKLNAPLRKANRQLLEKLREVRHPDILQVLAVQERDGLVYEILEYCRGGSLEGVAMPPERVERDVLSRMVNALRYLHEQLGVAHRDVKPGNLFFRKESPEQDVVLADFDISFEVGTDQTSHVTQSSQAATWKYAAPELFLSWAVNDDDAGSPLQLGHRITKPADYYALGGTLIELLGFPHPLEGWGYNQIAGFHLDGKRLEIPLSLPERMRTLLEGLLIRDYRFRWGADEVERWLRGESVAVRKDVGPAARSRDPYRIGEESAHDVRELAGLLTRYPELAIRDLKRGAISAWVDRLDTNLGRAIDEVRESLSANPELALYEIILILDPHRPFHLGETAVTSVSELVQLLMGPDPNRGFWEYPAHWKTVHAELGSGRIAAWLRRKQEPRPELANQVERIARRHGGALVAVEEMLYLLNPQYPYRLLPGLEAKNPEDLAMQIYGNPADWRTLSPSMAGHDDPSLVPPCYRAALTQHARGSIVSWLRTRGFERRVRDWQAIANQYSNPRQGLEVFLRILNPGIRKVRLDVRPQRTRASGTWSVMYGKAASYSMTFQVLGPGFAFGVAKHLRGSPGLSLGNPKVEGRCGVIEVVLDAREGSGCHASHTYLDNIEIDGPGLLEPVSVPVRYRVSFPVEHTLRTMLSYGVVGAALMALVRGVVAFFGNADWIDGTPTEEAFVATVTASGRLSTAFSELEFLAGLLLVPTAIWAALKLYYRNRP